MESRWGRKMGFHGKLLTSDAFSILMVTKRICRSQEAVERS